MVVRGFLSCFFFFSSRRRHTRFDCDWSSDVCSSDLLLKFPGAFFPLLAMHFEKAGFDGIYVSGGALSAALGLPDIGLTTLPEVAMRSEERRVGKECRSRWSPYH